MRKIKTGVETLDFFGFLTSQPNDVVGPIDMTSMPNILTMPEQVHFRLTASKEQAISLQRQLPDGVLQFVAVGAKADDATLNTSTQTS